MQVKIGVFICDCGGSLRNIDFPKIKGDLERIEDISFVDINHNLCLEEGKRMISSRILKEEMDRVVIAACSPHLCEDKFMRLLEGLRFNPYLLSVANIREQCSWAHEGDVTEKAEELVKMAINKARLIQPMEKGDVLVNKEVLVVGAGLSGLKSALNLSQFGIMTTLVEREPVLGGKLGEGKSFYKYDTGLNDNLDLMIKEAEKSERIEILTSAEITGVEGEAGNFSVRIKERREELSRSFGAIIFATGYKEGDLHGFAEPGINIILSGKLMEILEAPEKLERKPETIGFITDVFDESSRLPTLSALKNALAVKDRLGSEVYVFCKSLKVDGEGVEEIYRKARDRGVVIVKFEEKPRVYVDDRRVKIEAKDVLLGEEVSLSCDFLVAEERALPPEGTDILNSILHIGFDSQGFCQDENVYLYPVGSGRKGIFFVGPCRGSFDIARASMDVASAVESAYKLLASGKVTVELGKVKADPERCQTCLTCIRVCPHNAIKLVWKDSVKQVAQIYDLACDGCGICAAICPAKAINFKRWEDEQILAGIEAIGESL